MRPVVAGRGELEEGRRTAVDFDAFVRAHGGWLRSLVRAAAADQPADLEDLVQDTLLRAYLRRHRFTSTEHLLSWLRVSVRGLARDRRESWQRVNIVAAGDLLDDLAVGSDCDPADLVAAHEEQQEVLRALALLPEPARQLLWEHAVDGLSYAEIAGRSGTAEATVRSAALRARRAVQAQLARAGGWLVLPWRSLRVRSRGVRIPTVQPEGIAAGMITLSLFLAGASGVAAAAALPPHADRPDVIAEHEPYVQLAASTQPVQTATARIVDSSATAVADEPPRRRSPVSAGWSDPSATAKFTEGWSRQCNFLADDPLVPGAGTYSCQMKATGNPVCTSVDRDDQPLVTHDCMVYLEATVTGKTVGQPSPATLSALSHVCVTGAGGGIFRYLSAPDKTELLLEVKLSLAGHLLRVTGGNMNIANGVSISLGTVEATLPFDCGETETASTSGFEGRVGGRIGPRP